MPRKIAPDFLQIGPGKTVPETTTIQLNPTGGIDGDWSEYIKIGEGAIAALEAHIQDPQDAHPASAIGVNILDGDLPGNVEAALGELYSGASRKPPELGVLAWYPSKFGIPDWGALKMGDSSVLTFPSSTHPSALNDASQVYPYYMTASNPSPDWEQFYRYSYLYNGTTVSTADRGKEIDADLIWNFSDANVPGGGPGFGRAGAYTDGIPITRTVRIIPSTNLGTYLEVCVSGIVYPADRGVLAIIHWPSGGDVAAFLVEDLEDRCVAALLLGKGQDGDAGCFKFDSTGVHPCDGEPGGIFTIGFDSGGDYDPFAYPGRASGQYNLNELFTGVADYNGVIGIPAGFVSGHRTIDSEIPVPGQVRLGTVDAAEGGNVSPYGIPILGAGSAAYDGIMFATVNGRNAVANSFAVDSNFFAYRLPVLDSYKALSGLKYTPRGMIPYTTKETARYLTPLVPYDVTGSPDSFDNLFFLKQAGNYDWEDPQIADRLGPDYWTWQLARFRHSFYIPGSDVADVKVGTYWLLHFKTEHNFEQFVRDGEMPWVGDGYELYGAYPLTSIEGTENVVNVSTDTFAPDYGYASKQFWTNRSSVYVADKTLHSDCAFATANFDWSADPAGVMWCSGVAYLTPKIPVGTASFRVSALNGRISSADNPWTQGYRTDEITLTPVLGTDPAAINSPNPAFVYLGNFSNDPMGTYTIVGALTNMVYPYPKRVEFPFTSLGTFTESVGPVAGDDLTIDIGVGGVITFYGDQHTPSFSTDAKMRAFARRPLGPENGWEYAALPWSGVDHGAIMAPISGETLLFHSTSFDTTGLTGSYGNFVNGSLVGYSQLFSVGKDTYERFLDEMYRYVATWSGQPLAEQGALIGPGMQGWALGPIAVPVQAGLTASGTWPDASWVHTSMGIRDLAGYLTTELQVAGLPHRNPPLSDWVKYPFPSAGILMYPQTNYTANYRPDFINEGVTQFNYSVAAGDRVYVRAFDAAFSRAVLPDLTVDAVGSPYVYLRIDGVLLRDLAYSPPGPGNTTSGISFFLKVPGLTTWMDLGRVDGAGPSKQDPALDGAGCQVVGEYTYDCVDGDTGMVYCVVKAHVGPVATLALGDGSEVPVLVKVGMKDPAATDVLYFNLNTEANLATDPYGWTVVPVTGSHIECSRVRGITGIRLIHTDLVETNPGIVPIPPA